jgi:hypothetical protein
MPAQHGCPGPPQLPQLPAVQVMLIGAAHIDPAAVHRFATQQPPEVHVVFSQHGSPAPPHGEQMRGPPPPAPPVHTSLASQARPAQQGCPAAPHDWQMPPTHAPDEHGVFPMQQTAPTEPHAPAPPSPDPDPLLVQPAMRAKHKAASDSPRIEHLPS